MANLARSGRLSPIPPEGMRLWIGSVRGEACFWSSAGHWLHPLFDFLDRIDSDRFDGADFALRDRIIGRGAAWLILETGIQDVGSTIVSQGALDLLCSCGLDPCYDTLVERVDCATEDELKDVIDRETALRLLFARRDRARASSGKEKRDGCP